MPLMVIVVSDFKTDAACMWDKNYTVPIIAYSAHTHTLGKFKCSIIIIRGGPNDVHFYAVDLDRVSYVPRTNVHHSVKAKPSKRGYELNRKNDTPIRLSSLEFGTWAWRHNVHLRLPRVVRFKPTSSKPNVQLGYIKWVHKPTEGYLSSPGNLLCQ